MNLPSQEGAVAAWPVLVAVEVLPLVVVVVE